MEPARLFDVVQWIAMSGWLLLAILPRWRWTQTISAAALPAILPVIYLVLFLPLLRPGARRLRGIRLARRREGGVLDRRDAAGRLDSLPGVRPVRRELGSTRCAACGRTTSIGRALPVPHADDGAGGPALLPHPARRHRPAFPHPRRASRSRP